MISCLACFSLYWQLQQHQPFLWQHLSLSKLRMILHQPPTEEVPLPPLTFQSTPHCGQWHTWLGGELVSEVMFILLISVLFVHLLSKAHFCMLMACCILHFEKAENFVKYTVIYFIQLHVSTLLQIIFAPIFFLWFFLSCKPKS